MTRNFDLKNSILTRLKINNCINTMQISEKTPSMMRPVCWRSIIELLSFTVFVIPHSLGVQPCLLCLESTTLFLKAPRPRKASKLSCFPFIWYDTDNKWDSMCIWNNWTRKCMSTFYFGPFCLHTNLLHKEHMWIIIWRIFWVEHNPEKNPHQADCTEHIEHLGPSQTWADLNIDE